MNGQLCNLALCVALLFCATASAGDRLATENSKRFAGIFPPLRYDVTPQIRSTDDDNDQFGEARVICPEVTHSNDSGTSDGHSTQSGRLNHQLRTISFESGESECSSCIGGTDSALTPVAGQSLDWHPLDTLTLFGGLEGSKQPQDFGVNANFGSRWAVNWGFPLLAQYGIGMQIGTSINQTDNAVQVFERVGASNTRTQNYSTVGIFQRYDRWRWGIGYDALYESYFDQFFLGQWRGRTGYAVTNTDEVGIWFAVSQQRDSGTFQTIPVTLHPLNQGSIYWQHQFSAGTRTMAWMGASEGHAQANYALGDLKKTGDQFVFGAEVDVPLNPYLAIYGQANFIRPADTGTVDSYLGLAFYPGGHAFPAARNPFTPLMALANSTMFATDLRR